jgi:ribosomal protein S18 acetylase RimI-like enzyme
MQTTQGSASFIREPDGGEESVAAQPPPWQIESALRVSLRGDRVLTLRPVCATDAAPMAAFFAALTEREIYYFFDLDERGARDLALQAAHAPAFRLIAVDDRQERVLGYTFLQWRPAGLPSFGVCILADAQSLGLGWRLIDHLLRSAAASGVGRVALTVHPDNGRALRLYQRAGFRPVGDFINRHQGVKQYRMEADLQQKRPSLLEELSIVPLGGLGVAEVAAEVQRAIEERTGRLPLLLDRPASDAQAAIFVADLAVPPAYPGPVAEPTPHHPATAEGWITSLDQRCLLIGGVGVPALTLACRRYAQLLQTRWATRSGTDPLDAISLAELLIRETL